MRPAESNIFSQKVIFYEITAILFIIAVIWLDEILDIPFVLLGGPATPVNWRESLFESIILVIVGIIIVRTTRRLLARLDYLEGILPVCPSCKKIRDEKEFWNDIAEFAQERSKNEFTHGVCPDCFRKYSPELPPRESSSNGEG